LRATQRWLHESRIRGKPARLTKRAICYLKANRDSTKSTRIFMKRVHRYRVSPVWMAPAPGAHPANAAREKRTMLPAYSRRSPGLFAPPLAPIAARLLRLRAVTHPSQRIGIGFAIRWYSARYAMLRRHNITQDSQYKVEPDSTRNPLQLNEIPPARMLIETLPPPLLC
jgi:hypothetical protein